MTPLSMVDDRTPLYRDLVAYKRPGFPGRAASRHRLTALMALFWSRHAACIAPEMANGARHCVSLSAPIFLPISTKRLSSSSWLSEVEA